jgi:alanine racemase
MLRLPRVKAARLNTEAFFSARETALREGLRVWAEVDLDRIETNVRGLCALAGEARLLAVVKGNAYGHGAVPVGRAALTAGAWGLGVVSLEEGEELRRAGIQAPVLVLGSTATALSRRLVQADLRVTVGSLAQGVALSQAAQAAGRDAIIHIKVETGLNRFGVLPEECTALAEALRVLPGIVVEGLSTHLASVDEGDKTFTLQQHRAFQRGAEALSWIPLHHISSTGGLLDLPELRLAMVRCGIGVYGYYPSDEVSRSVDLQPALALRSRVARVSDVAPGQSVGYGRTWVAQRPSRVALVLAGYGDGLRRVLSNTGVALVKGRRAAIAGRIAMDMHMLDVTDIAGVDVDDEVTLIGAQGEESIDADEVGRLAGTISYEVLAGIMARVPRLYVRGGRIVACHDLAGYRECTTP